jgi:hypothetical protein
VIILILEYASVLYASQFKPTREKALNQAYSQYSASKIHNQITKQFSAPPGDYSILQFTEFILQHRLS